MSRWADLAAEEEEVSPDWCWSVEAWAERKTQVSHAKARTTWPGAAG